MHRVVEPGAFVGHQLCGGCGLDIDRRHPPCQRQRHAAHGGDRLAQLVVQLAGDQAPLLLDVLLDATPQLAAVGELQLSVQRAALGRQVVLQLAGHAVEGGADGRSLGARQRRQCHIELAGLHRVECGDDLAKRPQRAADQPEHQGVDQQQQRQRHPGQQAQFVPGIERGTRGVGLHHQLAVREVDRLHRRGGRDQRVEPGWRIAPGLVVRGRRLVEQYALGVEQLDVVGPDTADILQKHQHRRRALRRVAPDGAVEQLGRDPVGGHHLLMHRTVQAAELQADHRRQKGQCQRADDQVDLQAQRHGEDGGAVAVGFGVGPARRGSMPISR